MKHEKLIKREDGSRVKIDVEFYANSIMGEHRYLYRVLICGKGKKKFTNPANTDSYEYRSLSMPDRRKYEERQYLEYVTNEEILATKLELWNKLKPHP